VTVIVHVRLKVKQLSFLVESEVTLLIACLKKHAHLYFAKEPKLSILSLSPLGMQ
jgi:hypothetical protein